MAELIEERTLDSKTFEDEPGRFRKLFSHGLHYPGNGLEDVQLSFRTLPGEDISDRANVIIRFVRATRTLEITNRAGLGFSMVLPAGAQVVGPRTLQLTNAGITWTYTLRRAGMKLEAVVSAPRGPRTYTFPITKIGTWPHTIDALGNIRANNGAVVLVAPTFEITNPATGQRFPFSRPVPGGWRIQGGNPVFDFDDSAIPLDQYPYYLDPTTTFNVAASGDDGHAGTVEAVYPPTTGFNDSADSWSYTARLKDVYNLFGFGVNFFWNINGLLRWDTSSLPENAQIIAANLIAYVETCLDEDNRAVSLEWYDHNGIDNGDYTNTPSATAMADLDLTTLDAGEDTYYTFPLTGLTSINKAGYTGIRGHITGGSPLGYNYFTLATFDHATLTEPRLEVTYGLVLPGAVHQYRRRRT